MKKKLPIIDLKVALLPSVRPSVYSCQTVRHATQRSQHQIAPLIAAVLSKRKEKKGKRPIYFPFVYFFYLFLETIFHWHGKRPSSNHHRSISSTSKREGLHCRHRHRHRLCRHRRSQRIDIRRWHAMNTTARSSWVVARVVYNGRATVDDDAARGWGETQHKQT